MKDNKILSKIIIVLMLIAVVVCIFSIGYSEQLNTSLGGTGISMQYETELFDTSEIIEINIKMDEDQWEKMLNNATSEEYYVCSVEINGKTVKNVGIRPKGNTSLSAIAMDPDSDRYSLKLEFDHFVEGQTFYGLDKLILNNNYADATNMKETIIYDMYQYLDTDASLYNYAKLSVNGEYFGVYLALEGVEDSFMLRNYGTQDGELYKPETLGMNGGGQDKFAGNPGSQAPSGGNVPDFSGSDFDTSNIPSFNGQVPDGGSVPDFDGSDFDTSNIPSFNGQVPDGGSVSDFNGSGFNTWNIPGNNKAETTTETDYASNNISENNNSTGSRPNIDMSNFDMSNIAGGSSGSSGGANLNYTDDDLDSYSTIWEGAVTNTTKSDRRKVVTALKNISEGTNLETYIDVDNILKYMAVHTFAVNMDSLSGSMAHNYYLYEYDGQLNIIPWDYNLSFGGMSMGNSGNATDMINDAIDTPFSGTKFFDALLSNEEYMNRYHEYLQKLVDEYVNGGSFDEVYNRIRNQIDELVETDPTAFYSYSEYQTAVEIFYNTIMLRAKSIDGQLSGDIPSTDSGQKVDSSSLIDASEIDIAAMGQFSMGMSFGSKTDNSSENTNNNSDNSNDSSATDAFGNISGNMPGNFSGDFSGNMPSDLPSDIKGNMPGNFSGSIPDNIKSDFSGSFSGISGNNANMRNIIILSASFVLMIISLIVIKMYKRRRCCTSK